MTKSWQDLEKETVDIQKRFEQELSVLRHQGVISKTDIQKVMNQAEVSKKALVETVKRRDLNRDIQEEFFLSLIKDYQLSVQKIIDSAILRLGADVLVIYKFNQVNEKVFLYANQNSFTKSQIHSIENFSTGATAYALKTLPRRATWGKSLNFKKIIDDYAEILREHVEQIHSKKTRKFPLQITRSK